MEYLKSEFRAQIDLAYIFVCKDGLRAALGQNLSVIQNVCMVTYSECFPDIVVGEHEDSDGEAPEDQPAAHWRAAGRWWASSSTASDASILVVSSGSA